MALDSEPVKDDQEEYLMIHRHYKRLMEFQHARECKFYFIPENNLGLESAHLNTMVKDIPGVETYFDKENKAGVRKDGAVTRGYHFLLTLTLSQGTLRFDRDCFTTTREKTIANMKDLLQEQMLRFHWEHKKANDAYGKPRFALTGKLGDKQDDLLITVAMFLYWAQVVTSNRTRHDTSVAMV